MRVAALRARFNPSRAGSGGRPSSDCGATLWRQQARSQDDDAHGMGRDAPTLSGKLRAQSRAWLVGVHLSSSPFVASEMGVDSATDCARCAS